MTKFINLDTFKGMAFAAKPSLEVIALRLDDNWTLQTNDCILLDARGNTREFKTLDALHAFVQKHITTNTSNFRISIPIFSGLNL